MDDKQHLLTILHEEFERWKARLAGLSEAQISTPVLPENWSIKDVVAHLRAWQQRSVARLEAAHQGREPVYPKWPEQFDLESEGEPHDLNAWLYAQSRDQPWPTVHAEWSTVSRRFMELAAAIPENDLLQVGAYSWLEGYALVEVLQGSLEHHQEHAEYLEPLLVQFHQHA